MIIKTDLLFPVIKDNSDFIKTHPILHPHSTSYEKYWLQELERLIYGYWGTEKDEYRYIPPQLYYFINYHTMMVTKNKQRVKSRPYLWDINYTIMNLWFIARGFSGFENDDEYTCNWAVKLKENKVKDELAPDVPIHLEETITEHCYKKDGTLKQYIDPLEYLNSTHATPLGNPVYDNYAYNLFVFGSRGGGKMLKINELVRIKGGWKPIIELNIGEEVYGSDGKLCKVINKSIPEVAEFYRITLRDGRTIEACKDHQWKIFDKNKNKKKDKKEIHYNITTTKDIYDKYFYDRKNSYRKSEQDPLYVKEYLKAIPTMLPIDENKIDEDKYLPPYLIGLLLGDGCLTANNIMLESMDESILDYASNICDKYGWKYSIINHKNKKSKTFRFSLNNNNSINSYLDKLGLLKTNYKTKFIPDVYKYASLEDKMELIRGLMDTDGFADASHIEYTTVSNELSKDFIEVLRSCGINCKHSTKETFYTDNKGEKIECSLANRINIYTNKKIFNLERKQKFVDSRKGNRAAQKYNKTFIVNVEKIEDQLGVCIEVDSYDNTYVTKDYIVTHNSFLGSSIMEHEFLTDGAKTMDNYLKGSNKVEIFCGAPLASKSSDLLEKFEESLKSLPGEFSDGREHIPSPFSRQTSGSLKVGNSKNPYRFEYEKKIGNSVKTVGTGTLLKHETFKDNKQAAVGGRYTVLVLEEVGLEDSLLTIHGANRSTQDLGAGKFGSSLYIGTSGDVDKVVETEIIYRDPLVYDFLAFEDVYEGRGHIGFFLPAYYTNEKFKDENGNTMVDKAIEYEMYEREKAKKANNTIAYDELIMSRPLKPSEMFMSRTGNKFPVAMLREVQAANEKYEYKKHLRTIGNFIEDKEYIYGVKFKPDYDKKPIDRFPHDNKGNLEGAWEFYEHPPAGLIPPNLYKIVYDPIKDEGGGTSLAAIYVYKSNNTLDLNGNEIIAWWVGRYDKPDDIHLQCILAAKYFNAQVMFENNIIDFKNYCMRTGNYHILANTPKQIIEKALRDPSFKYDVGIPMTNPLKQYSLRLAQQWLLEEKKTYTEQLLDGTTRDITERNLHAIKDNLLLEELIQYHEKGNYDRVSAFLLLMLWLEQDKELVIKEAEEVVKKTATSFYADLDRNRLKSTVLTKF